MTRAISSPDCNLYEDALDVVTASVLVIAMIKGLGLVDADAEIIADTLLENVELADIHALAKARAPDLLGRLIRQAEACLKVLSMNGRIDISRTRKSQLRDVAQRIAKEERV